MALVFVSFNALLLLVMLMSFTVQWRLAANRTTIAGLWKNTRRYLTAPDYIGGGICLLYIAVVTTGMVSKVLDQKPPVWVVYLLITTLLASLVALCLTDKVIFGRLKQYKAWTVLGLGLLGTVISYCSAPLADSAISGFTRLDASAFPRAQAIYVVVMSVLLWPMALVVIGILLYLPVLYASVKIGVRLKGEPYRYMGDTMKALERRKDYLAGFRQAAIFIVLTVSVVLVPQGVTHGIQTDAFNNSLKRLLVFSSFHLPPQACGLNGRVPDDARIVPIRYRLASIAIADEHGNYSFKVMPCHVPELAGVDG